MHSKNKNLYSKINKSDIAKRTLDFSGVELESILNKSAILDLCESKNNAKAIIKLQHLFEAIDCLKIRIIKHKTSYDEKMMKKIIAVQENGQLPQNNDSPIHTK